MGQVRILALLAVLGALLLAGTPSAGAQTCAIQVTAQPLHVGLPSSAIPQPGVTTFAETFDVNYSDAYVNKTMILQYFDGSEWRNLQTFAGNFAGFTELTNGLDDGWARLGQNTVRVVGGTCASDQASFVVGYDGTAAPIDIGIYATLAALAVAFIFLGKSLGWKRFLVLAVPAYLALAPWTGQRYDMYFLISSGIRMLQHVNPFDPGNPAAYPSALKWAYPPIYPLYSALSFLLYQGLTGASLPSVTSLTWPGWLTSAYNVYLAYIPTSLPVLAFLLKLPMIASAILTGAVLTRMTGKESSAIWWVANPLVVLVAAIWGQLDPIATLLAVSSLYFFQRGKEYQAYLLASFGAAVKVWPALIIPIMLAISVRKGHRHLRPAVAVIPAVLITVALYSAYGDLVNNLLVVLVARGIPTYAGAFSVKGLTWQQALFVLKSPPVPVFLYLGIPAYLGMLAWVCLRRDTDVIKWTVVSVMILFLTYNYVNPQYFYWVLPLLMLQGRRVSTFVFTVLPLVFLAFSYDVFYFLSPAILPNEFAVASAVVEQLKVNFFNSTPLLLVAIAGVIPTAAYALLLDDELRPSESVASRVRRVLPFRSREDRGLST